MTPPPNRLRVLRVERGLGQRQLAALIGVDRSNLSRFESGDREPSVRVALRLAAALEVSVEELGFADPRAAVAPA
jgi:transcriptional regulator with XRE-family HTH domain